MNPGPHSHSFQEMAKRLLQENPDVGMARQFFNEAAASGRMEEAADVFRRALEQNPRNIEMHGLFIAVLLEQGEQRQALASIWDLMAYTVPEDGLLDAALAVRKNVDTDTRSSVMETPDLSVCMIVRNERPNLARALGNIKEFADEIVVVDTGSEDRSQDIARIFGVRLLSFSWEEDFSAARNYSLEHARGDWILVLDADECISPLDFADLRAIIAPHARQAAAYAMTTRNYSRTANLIGLQENTGIYGLLEAGLGWFPSTKVRLFRNIPQIRFHFPVHERVEPSLRGNGIAVETCSVPVHHYGHLNESRNLAKARHYYHLGRAKLDQMENDPHALRELAVQAGQMNRWEEAIDLWQRLLKIVPDYPEALINMAGAYWQTDDYCNALRFSEKAVQSVPRQKEARFNLAISLMMSGSPDMAVRELNALLEDNPDYVSARFMAAAAACLAGDQEQAGAALRHLSHKIDGTALHIAVDDLSDKCRRSGLDAYAQAIVPLKYMLDRKAEKS